MKTTEIPFPIPSNAIKVTNLTDETGKIVARIIEEKDGTIIGQGNDFSLGFKTTEGAEMFISTFAARNY